MSKSFASPSLDSLVDLACRDGVDIRPTLLRVLTDLYVQKPTHTAEEERQYVELATRLFEAVDAPTRDQVAARLSNYAAAPASILRKLGGNVSPTMARASAQAAAKPAPESDLVELFFAANAEERRLILIHLDVAAGSTARQQPPASSDVINRLERAALQHNASEFSRTLERETGIPRTLAERIAQDASGEPIVVAAKALGMQAEVLQRILLFLNPAVGQSVQRVYELAQLFDEISRASAARMLAIWRQSGSRAQVRHVPMYWDDERKSARSVANPSRSRAERIRETRPSRRESDGRG
jgi:Uncharacterised protein conserved in bacteria (DUF2336)